MTIVIGVGNRDRADDGAGPAVADRVRERATEGVEVVTSGGDPVELIDAWSGADLAIVVDALVPRGRPGRIVRFDGARERLDTELFAASTHEFGVAQAIELARALGRLPDRLLVVGIEARRFDRGGPVSPEVTRAVASVADDLLDQLRSGARPPDRREPAPIEIGRSARKRRAW